MTSRKIIAAAYLLDWLAGDPEWLPHPVRLIGQATEAGEDLLRSPGQSATTELAAGAALTGALVISAYAATTLAIQQGRRIHPAAGALLETLLGWTCLATRNLIDESQSVIQAVENNNLPQARNRLARIVGRDTQNLSQTEIHRAVIETLAESACDGIVAPLTYMAVGGVPLAMAYKAANTLDSMIGHADQHYYYFGKAAARLDDLANYLPARLTALAILLAAGPNAAPSAWHTWQRDGKKHKSPNAGNPESAIAGALRVRLGGCNTYAGESLVTPLLGAEFPPPTLPRARRALGIVTMVSFLGLVAALCLRTARR